MLKRFGSIARPSDATWDKNVNLYVSTKGTAAMSAMAFNFVLNNVFTYRDYRLRGWRFVRGFVLFYLFCSFGFILNVIVAILVFEGTK